MGMQADIEEFARIADITPRKGEVLAWDDSSVEVGIRLPADYRAFIDAFGGGDLYGRLGVNTPWPLGDPPAGVTALRALLNDAIETNEILRGLRDSYPAAFPFAFYPEPGGLLAWGGGIGGDLCFWLTEAHDPDAWPVVVWDKAEWRRYDMGMVALLIRALTKGDPFIADLVAPEPDLPVWNPRL
ncbi:hypothetical protein [Streptomyces sp. NPDC004728]|uniref:hypothetical protein n=1 Tax=Streptomyces sp. NPDC004728 TaxID=3154289 RepID=UPI0033AE789E